MTAIERPTAGRSAEVVLAEWRRAERVRDEFDTESDAWHEADRLVEDLRAEYQSAVRARVERMLAS
jgi:hypothetical protein